MSFHIKETEKNELVAWPGHLPPGDPTAPSSTFTMQYRLKEKRPKAVMRLGKKKQDKDTSGEARIVDVVTRLICLSKGQSPLRVFIDGSEWSGVKFFQLSSLWQTHIKYFPVATFGQVTSL